MEHTSNQPTLVHAKFLVSLFKKGIELAGEMPEDRWNSHDFVGKQSADWILLELPG